MAEEKKLTLVLLASMLKETNERLDVLTQVVTKQHQEESSAVDENSIVEKVQAQLARSFLPAVEKLETNLKTVVEAVTQVQQNAQNEDARIQTKIESVFQRNLSGIQASIAQQVGELKTVMPTPGAPPEPVSRYGGTVSLFTNIITGLLAAAQANPEGVKAIAAFIRPALPVEAVLMDKMAQSFKLADTITKMQRAIASGEDVNKVIQSYTIPAKT
jgi:Mg2+ and Co2+ transporter CorA